MSVALILSADLYKIPDSQTGELQHLHQVWMANDYRVSTENEKGCKPVKTLVDPGVFVELMKHDLPSLFDVEMTMRPGKGNTLAAAVVGFKYLGTPKIFSAPVPSAKAA